MLVLNATFEPINVCTVRRAAVLLLKEKAEVLEHGALEAALRQRATLPRPVVIRLVTYVRVPRDTHRRKITRRAVFARDDWTCQYCGSRSNLTVDHVIPRSKGGGSSWDNIVASCAPCNRRKGDRLPHQVGHAPALQAANARARTIFIQRRQADDPVDLAAVPAAARSRLAGRRPAPALVRAHLPIRGDCVGARRPRPLLSDSPEKGGGPKLSDSSCGTLEVPGR